MNALFRSKKDTVNKTEKSGDFDMKTKSENLLPKILRGTVHRQFVRCGKAVCKCADGMLHGPYYYLFVRVDGKLKKRYLKSSEVEKIQAECIARQNEKKSEAKSTDKIWNMLRALREELRNITGSYKY